MERKPSLPGPGSNNNGVSPIEKGGLTFLVKIGRTPVPTETPVKTEPTSVVPKERVKKGRKVKNIALGVVGGALAISAVGWGIKYVSGSDSENPSTPSSSQDIDSVSGTSFTNDGSVPEIEGLPPHLQQPKSTNNIASPENVSEVTAKEREVDPNNAIVTTHGEQQKNYPPIIDKNNNLNIPIVITTKDGKPKEVTLKKIARTTEELDENSSLIRLHQFIFTAGENEQIQPGDKFKSHVRGEVLIPYVNGGFVVKTQDNEGNNVKITIDSGNLLTKPLQPVTRYDEEGEIFEMKPEEYLFEFVAPPLPIRNLLPGNAQLAVFATIDFKEPKKATGSRDYKGIQKINILGPNGETTVLE